jgi:hypothetical protein
LVPDLIEGGPTHLQYADDTILFLNLDEESICNTKFLLYCFEAMSGLRINYQKSEIFILEATIEKQREVDGLFNCNIGEFPMKYLGVMLDKYYMSSLDFAYVYQKVEKRVPTWQSCLMSYGGKMILTESCLSSVPNYVMGVFHLKGEAHHKMETARSNFFWHGPGQKKKYHMMRWEVLATPKPIGGLGFTDTRVMNQCLLSKWIFKLERGDNNPCCKMLRAKYLGEGGFYCSKSRGVSQFWAGLHDVKHCYARGLVYIVKNAKKARFWLDVWLGQCSLCISYNRIFRICNEQNSTVHDVL